MAQMDDFVAYTSRWRTGLLVAASVAFVAIGMWMAGLMGPVPVSQRSGPLMTQVWGWVCTLFFGMCAFASAKIWWENGERLRIGRSGMRWSSWSDQTIPWSEIADVTEWHYRRSSYIILHLRNPSHFPGKGTPAITRWANRKLTGGDMGITLTGTDRKFADAMAAVAQFRP